MRNEDDKMKKNLIFWKRETRKGIDSIENIEINNYLCGRLLTDRAYSPVTKHNNNEEGSASNKLSSCSIQGHVERGNFYLSFNR